MGNEYIDRLMKELESSGVKPAANFNSTFVEDRNIKVLSDIEKATGIKYSEEQKSILMHKGSACILACAGSGKTSTSIHLIAKRVMTGEIHDTNKLMFMTYNKSGATEMKTRLDTLLKKLSLNRNIEVKTIHSFFYKLLRTFGVQYDVITDWQRKKFIRESCKDAGLKLKEEDLLVIDNLLSYQVNNLLSDKKTLMACVNTLPELKLEEYSNIRNGYASRKAAAKVIDFDDMQSYLYIWLVKNKKSTNEAERNVARDIRNYCKALWDYYFIDEAQDVSKIQFAIIKEMVADPDKDNVLDKQLVFIGDDDQSIYSWRGSDPSIILSIGPMFDIQTFVLSTNYRCKSNIVDFAVKGIKCNTSRYAKSMSAYSQGGDVRILCAEKDDLCSLSELAVNHIKWWLANGSGPEDIAVLVRNNFHASILNTMLLKQGIYCNIADDMKLTSSNQYKEAKKILDLCRDCRSKEVTSSMLWKLCRYMKVNTAKVIADFQNDYGLSFTEALGYLCKNIMKKEVTFNKSVPVALQVEEQLNYYVSTMRLETCEDMVNLYMLLTSDEDDCAKVQHLFTMYLSGTAYMYATADSTRSIRGIANYVVSIVNNEGYEQALSFFRVVEQFERGNVGVLGNKLTLTTMHGAKGREWKNVIMFGVDTISSPSMDNIGLMLEHDVSDKDISENIDEERRLYYVGNTRAKDNLLLITSKRAPGMFIMESLGIITKDCNDEIILGARGDNKQLLAEYVPKTISMIEDKNSPYYYDVDKYKTE